MTDRPMRVAIVGCGLIGRKRAAALAGARLVACADLDRSGRGRWPRSAPGVARGGRDWRDRGPSATTWTS